jgi:hypothetical protein
MSTSCRIILHTALLAIAGNTWASPSVLIAARTPIRS